MVEVVCSTDYLYHVSWIRSKQEESGRSSCSTDVVTCMDYYLAGGEW